MERGNSFIFAGRPKIDKDTVKKKLEMKCFKNAKKCYGIDCNICILNYDKFGKKGRL
jgi:hypothetical protein